MKHLLFALISSVLLLYSMPMLIAQKTKIKIKKVEALEGLKGRLMAGSATTDITPPPGLASGARSITGKKKMKGFRTRLKARTLCIRDQEGTSIALVQLDLAFGSLILHHQIAEEIAQKTDIPIGNIVLTCTHTHSGPTGYYGNDFYNTNAGAVKGFEPTLYGFLKDQIITSILEAQSDMRPAKIATGSIDIKGYTRNRSIDAYVRNEGNESLDAKNPNLIFEAINPTLYMLRVDALDGDDYKPLGAFSVFAIHGTAVGDRVDVFNGDVFAFAQRDLEWMIADQYQTSWKPIHAFCNGTEGDIAPNMPFYKKNGKETKRIPVDWMAVRNIGIGIAGNAWKLFEQLKSKLKNKVTIRVATREVNILENNTIDNVSISRKPTFGTATLGGAYENRSFATYIFNAGSLMTQKRLFGKKGLQGNKKVPLRPLMKMIYPPSAYPQDVMFQLIEIDDFLLVPTPWEITITAGERISNGIKDAYKSLGLNVPKHIAIASNSNDYLSYATTPEEYAQQNYEGGQTIYGKNTVPYITAQLHHLTRDMLQQGNISEFPDEWEVNIKTKNRFPKGNSNLKERTILEQPQYISGGESDTMFIEDYWILKWTDVLPGDIQLHHSFVEIERSYDEQNWSSFRIDRQPIIDEGFDLEVRIEKQKRGHAIYAAKWYNPEKDPKAFYRFVIYPRNKEQGVLYSETFQFEK